MTKRRTTVYIDPDLVTRLVTQYPMQGTLSWLMETAIEAILEATDGQPEARELVRSSIRASLLRARIARRAIDNASATRVPAGVTVTAIEVQRDSGSAD